MTCEQCPKYNKCKSPCEAIEKQLRDNGIYSQDWIRPQVSKEKRTDGLGYHREIGVDNIDDVAIQRAFELKYGKKKPKIAYDE